MTASCTLSGQWRRRMIRNLPPTAACQTLLNIVGKARSANDSGDGSTSDVSAIVMVGRPSPTSPFTVPATRNTARPKTICPVVTGPLVPPGEDGRDQGEHGDDLGEARPPAPARRRLGLFGPLGPQ